MDQVKAKANYSRICQLLIDKGGIALRRALHEVHPPSTLATVLNANKATLQKIRKRVIKASQWDLLFPASGSPDSNNFDITLLTILLRNICALPSPATGWDVMPPPSETSISADIARIKILRNQIYGHISRAEYDDATFEKYWQDISGPLIKLGIPQKDVDELKVAPLSPEEETYIEKLKEWKEVEDELLSRLAELEIDVLNLQRAVESLSISKIQQLAKCNFTTKINDLCSKFLPGTRRWFFDQLSSWFEDKESRVMILTAGPGIGKSVLFAKICEMYKQYGQLAACHFCDFKKSDFRNPHIILESLAAQMCDNVDGFGEKLNEVSNRKHSRESLSDAFRVLLEDPLHDLIRTEPMLIVIDALDESKTEVKSEFLELIAEEFENLPKWIKILISSRPELQVREQLEFFNPLEILPDDHPHLQDLKHFIKSSLTNVSEDVLISLLSECKGSFLYAYYLVNELKLGGQGFEPKSKDNICKGIAGFYHKQFTRLKTGLQRFEPNKWSLILKSFINIIAASKDPLPCKILFTCMGLSGEEFEVRKMIIGFMSEILPIYDNCLTVYHKSLWDWLTSNGYEEHAFKAKIEDGKYRLWRVCENVYYDILSFRSISDFLISPETSYALKSGEKFLLDVGRAEDFHWLVNVRLNFFKLQLGKKLKFSMILAFGKSKHLNHHYWGIIHFQDFSKIYHCLRESFDGFVVERDLPYIYLQSLANGYFDFVQKSISGKNEARDILDEKNMVWAEECGNECIRENKIISHAIMGDKHLFLKRYALAVSRDNKLIAHKQKARVEVFHLPNLTMVFSLEIKDSQKDSEFLQFSPDSSYLVWNSARSCISLTSQMEVPLIPNGPENVDSVSFSPCGMRLTTFEKKLIKLWNVKSKDLIATFKTDFNIEYSIFSDCNSCIFVAIEDCNDDDSSDDSSVDLTNHLYDDDDSSDDSLLGYFSDDSSNDSSDNWSDDSFDDLSDDSSDVACDFAIFNSVTLERLNNEKFNCTDCCLTKEDDYQIVSPPPTAMRSLFIFEKAELRIRHFHSPTGRIVLLSNKYCSNPFKWKDKKCVIFLRSQLSLIFYDFVNKKVVDMFDIDFLPTRSFLRCLSKLDGTNFLVGLHDNQTFVLSLEASTEFGKTATRHLSAIKCYAISPDDSYIACCSKDLILTIKNVNNGKTLQTVELKHRPKACWWSEFYLWVICKGMVVKYPYNSAQTKVLGNEIEECSINFDSVVAFKKDVLVIEPSYKTGICMLKICDENLYSQQIPDSDFYATSASVSSDGCAVLLFCEFSSDYQLWETAGGHRWELGSSGGFDKDDEMALYCLTGTANFRTSIWQYGSSKDLEKECLTFSCIDFATGTTKHDLILPFLDRIVSQLIYVNSKVCIIYQSSWIHFFRVTSGEIITSLYLGLSRRFQYVASFFLASRCLILLGGKKSIKIFRIRNIEKLLPDLIED